METSCGSVDHSRGPDAVPLWGGTNRERRNRPARPLIDLTEPPRQRPRLIVRHWNVTRLGNDTALFNLISATLMVCMGQRNTDAQQMRSARQALRGTNELRFTRHAIEGYSFEWTWRCQTFHFAVREEDQLTRKLDRQQPIIDHLIEYNDKVG